MDDSIPTNDPQVTPDNKPELDSGKFDATAFGASIKADILAEVESKHPELAEQFTAKAKKEIAQELAQKLIGEDNKPKKYIPKDFDEWEGHLVKRMEEKLEEREKKSQEQSAKAQDQVAASEKKWNEYWESQEQDLVKDGALPDLPKEMSDKLKAGKKLSAEELNHPAVQARQELYVKSRELKDEGYRDWFNLETIYYKYLTKSSRSDGRDAPVMHRGSGITNRGDGELRYADFRGKSMEQIAMEGQKKGK